MCVSFLSLYEQWGNFMNSKDVNLSQRMMIYQFDLILPNLLHYVNLPME